TASAAATDLVAVARGAGIVSSAWAFDEADFERLAASALKGEGVSLIAARIDNKSAVATTDRDPVQIRERFMRGLGVKAGGVCRRSGGQQGDFRWSRDRRGPQWPHACRLPDARRHA